MTVELLISANPYGIRAAEVADGQVRAFHVESADQPSRIGDICFATCTRPMPALGGAFFDAGFAEPVFMSRAGSVKAGDGMLVQISADATLGKGMRVTRHLSLAGRLVVLEPAGKGGALAASLDGDTALQALATTLATDLGVRVTLRSAAAGADHAAIEAEAKRISACWDDLCDSQKTKPGVLHQAGGLLGRLLRDVARPDIARITIDDPACHKRAVALANVEAPDLSDRLFQHDGDGDLIERYDGASVLEDACGETHALPSGGCLYIEQTRAMVTIDVDSASDARPSRGWTDELAQGISQAIMQRNLSGVIVIDTPRTGPASARPLTKALEVAMRADRVPHRVLGATKGGLVEVTRKRVGVSLEGAGLHGARGRYGFACAAAYDVAQQARREKQTGAHRLRMRASPQVASILAGETALPGIAPWLGIVCEVASDTDLAPGICEVSRA